MMARHWLRSHPRPRFDVASSGEPPWPTVVKHQIVLFPPFPRHPRGSIPRGGFKGGEVCEVRHAWLKGKYLFPAYNAPAKTRGTLIPLHPSHNALTPGFSSACTPMPATFGNPANDKNCQTLQPGLFWWRIWIPICLPRTKSGSKIFRKFNSEFSEKCWNCIFF